tara:strand:- start:478 stop:801 length:324 start_codon:yes stop_codon:yes gene_type:complete
MSQSEPGLATQTDDNYRQANRIVFKLDSDAKTESEPGADPIVWHLKYNDTNVLAVFTSSKSVPTRWQLEFRNADGGEALLKLDHRWGEPFDINHAIQLCDGHIGPAE